MPQRQVLEDEISAGADRSEECCDKQTEVEHRRASRGSPILCYLSIEPHGSSFAVPRRAGHVPAVTRVGGRGDGAAADDGPGCRRRADAAALSSRGQDLGGRGPKRRVLRQADGGRAQTSLSWLADTLLSQDRAAPIRFCRPTGVRWLEIEARILTLELALLEEHGLTLPPETQPLRGFARRGQTRWRRAALYDTQRALARAKLRRWVRRVLTLGMWWR